jgi:hypothetical protein
MLICPRARAGALLAAVAVMAALASGCHRRPRPRHWRIGVTTFDAVALGLARTRRPDPFVDAIRPTLLEFPTYIGHDEATHPDVLVERDPSGAAHVTMVMTPYPIKSAYQLPDDFFENPSLLESHDGMAFAIPPGVRNPLVAPPPRDHNDDPDLRRDPRTGEYRLLYLETQRPDRQILVQLHSRDLVHWTRRDALVSDLRGGEHMMLSPAAIDEAGATHLFYVDNFQFRLYHVVSRDGETWDAATAAPVRLDLGAVKPWHVDVIRGEGSYGLLISGFEDTRFAQNVYLATSPDLVTWTLRPQPLLSHTELDVDSMYRSTGVVESGTLVVWYGMRAQE